MVDRSQVIEKAQSLLALTYDHSAGILPAIIDENLAQLPGGEDWKEGNTARIRPIPPSPP
jgi:hypothetical protein